MSSYLLHAVPYVPRVPQEIIDLTLYMASLLACTLVCWTAARPGPDIPLPLLGMLLNLKSFSLFKCSRDLRAGGGNIAAGGGRAQERLHVLAVVNAPAAFLRTALSLRVVSLFYVDLYPAEKVRKRKARPTQSQLVEAVGTSEYLSLSLDSNVRRVLEYRAGSEDSTHLQLFLFSLFRRLALNPISNGAGSAQNFARVLRAVEGTLERLETGASTSASSSAMRWATDYTATMGVDRRPVGVRARSAAASRRSFFIARPAAALLPSFYRLPLSFFWGEAGFEVLWGAAFVSTARARFCYLLAALYVLEMESDAPACVSARARAQISCISGLQVLRYRYRALLAERPSVGAGLQAFGARSLGFVLVDTQATSTPALYDHARLTRLRAVWLHIIMEAAPLTRPWFRRRTMRTDTTRRTLGPPHLHPKVQRECVKAEFGRCFCVCGSRYMSLIQRNSTESVE
ncbi:hypothetical protein B0H14DRAFT_3908940 [Mycena olivaceomarginata]|nr:hypothetical protein B0H14DRAFT_3908940 [Mycena olivaceomarginata]